MTDHKNFFVRVYALKLGVIEKQLASNWTADFYFDDADIVTRYEIIEYASKRPVIVSTGHFVLCRGEEFRVSLKKPPMPDGFIQNGSPIEGFRCVCMKCNSSNVTFYYNFVNYGGWTGYEISMDLTCRDCGAITSLETKNA